MDCVFCEIEDERIVRESENTITILSNPYLMKGHSLVIPRTHVERLSELPQKVRYELVDEAMNMQELLMQRIQSPGCDLRQNYRPFLPNSKFKVGHLHLHVIPRFPEDELYQKSMIHETLVFMNLNLELRKSLMEKLK